MIVCLVQYHLQSVLLDSNKLVLRRYQREGEGSDPISYTNFRKNACLVCTLDRIFQVSQIKREDFKSHLTSPIEV